MNFAGGANHIGLQQFFLCTRVKISKDHINKNIIEIKKKCRNGEQKNGSGALSGKNLVVRIIKNNKFDDYIRSG